MTGGRAVAGLGAMALALGCTDGDMASNFGDPDDMELAANPGGTAAPVVVSIPLGLWFDPFSLETGDFDGDGANDILVAGVAPGVGVAAAIYLGDGLGGFAAPIDPGFGGCSAFPLAGDLNGDGRSDVITLGCGGTLAVYAGQADGTLLPWADWHDHEYGLISANAVADFEGDGDADLISLHVEDSAYLELTLGNGGHGIWGVETSEIGNPDTSDFGPVGLIAGHFDQDGLIDVALLDRDYDVAYLRGVAPANFAFPRELGVDIQPWSIRAGDVDNDSLTDIIVSSTATAEVQILRADWAGGGFQAFPPVRTANAAPYDTAIGDITGDGNLDIAMISNVDNALTWLPGDGTGSYNQRRRFQLPSAAIRIHAARFDGDDADDLVAATFDDDSLTFVLSNN